jgi:dual-specificity kinase
MLIGMLIMCLPSFSDEIKNLLGQGTFGKVVRCKDRMRDREVAIKIIRSIQKYTDAAQIEIRVLRALRDRDPDNVK